MRRRILIAIAGLAAGAAASAPGGSLRIGPAVAHADSGQVLIVGDSLAVGMQPYLGEMIADRELTFAARAGRTTPQGLRVLRLELQRQAPQTVVINLGTNDGSNAGVFANRVRRALLEVPPQTCIVWPAIARPPRKGAYEALNGVLRDAARRDPRLTIINWDRMVDKGTVALRDGVHPDAEGYRFRAWVTAAAVQRGC